MKREKVDADTPPDGFELPPFSVTVHFKKKILHVSVVLHKIPDKYIHLEPSETHLHLNTGKFSKKYYLNFAYPQRIKINTNNVKAELNHGVLDVLLQIDQIEDKISGKLLARKSNLYKSRVSQKASRVRPNEEESDRSTYHQKENIVRRSRGKILSTKEKDISLSKSIEKRLKSQVLQGLQKEQKKIEYFRKKQLQKEQQKRMLQKRKEKILKPLIQSYIKKPAKRVVRFVDEHRTPSRRNTAEKPGS